MRIIPLAIVASALFTSSVWAQAPAKPQSTAIAQIAASGKWRASKVVGVKVYNNENTKIGEIEEIIIDSAGRVEGAVVGVGGFLEIGERKVMLPLDKIKFENEESKSTTGSTSPNNKQWYPDRAVVSATKDQLKAMPEFKY